MYGDITTEEDNRVERVIGALVSDAVPLTQHLVTGVEGHLSRGDLSLIVARSSRKGWIGNVLLSRVRWEGDVLTGYVTALLVLFGARGTGVGRLLLSSAEAIARRNRLNRLVAFVAPDNARSLRLFHSEGYSKVSGEDLAGRSAEERDSVPEGKLLLEKGLAEV